jgi:hypothetical protein
MSMGLKLAQQGIRTNQASAALSRRANVGDPGLFGFLGKVAGTVAGFIPGPVGTIAQTAIGALSGGSSTTSGATKAQTLFNRTSIPTSGGFAVAPVQVPVMSVPAPPSISGGPTSGVQEVIRKPGLEGLVERMLPGGDTGFVVRQANGNGAVPSGFHLNKTSYFLKDGTFVPAGSRYVKNRRRNPLNPRAASNAVRRLESTKKAVRRFDRVQIKCKRCGCARCKC